MPLFFYYRNIDRLTADVERPFQLDDKLTRIELHWHCRLNVPRQMAVMAQRSEKNDSVGVKNVVKNVVKSGVKSGVKLSENEKTIYERIRLNSDITTKSIPDDLGIDLRTVQRCLPMLKESGLVIREGSKINGGWG